MSWNRPFVIYRITAEGKLESVYVCDDIKQAKYWLNYIAQPGDVLCRTPAHPKHSKGSNRPEYCCHKEQSGSSATEESRWREFAKHRAGEVEFPEEQPPVTP